MRRILDLCWGVVAACFYGFFKGWKFWRGIAEDERKYSEQD